MHAMKNVAASAKEKVQNLGAKADHKKEETKTDAQTKVSGLYSLAS
jgi:hypothetical protein